MQRTLSILILSLGLWGCQQPSETMTDEVSGVSYELAQKRKASLQNIHYQLEVYIPEAMEEALEGKLLLTFDLARSSGEGVVLDFRQDASNVHILKINESETDPVLIQDHLYLPAGSLKKGRNEVQIDFRLGDLSLNRNPDFLYTLFVPDRASTAIPCFDQPNLKATYSMELDIPKDWEGMTNGPLDSSWVEVDRKHLRFKTTKAFSTYVWAFVAGKFSKATQERDGRSFTAFYRESDQEKVANNLDALFDLHAQAIAWMEDYTGLALPFQKLDFALLPGFQYGGMEHIGAIFYRESSLMLDQDATQNQLLGRARLIAHETAHMWFGDLVTMEWFNDVWLKEVFANFMAAKIVNPAFPEINHDLSFLRSHHPSAYSEDRSGGSHPIQQQLENLKDAGTLYGRIIYQKAPVVMRQLELMVGEEVFQEGLREYLRTFAYANAEWDDLIAILDQRSDKDLEAWSQTWVKEAGMPQIRMNRDAGANTMLLEQTTTSPSGLYWEQQTRLAIFYPDSIVLIPVELHGKQSEVIPLNRAPLAILPNAAPHGYGYFQLDPKSRDYLIQNLVAVEDPLLRGSGWIALFEECVQGELSPDILLTAVRAALPLENDPLLRQALLGYLSTLFWQYSTPEQRETQAGSLEDELWQLITNSKEPSTQLAVWDTYLDLAITPAGIDRLWKVWREENTRLSLSEPRKIRLGQELALKQADQEQAVLNELETRIKNPDRLRRLRFVRPALAADPVIRDSFFQTLLLAENRETEPWVGEALQYLNHPLRSQHALKYILPGLEALEEVQATGDIFFPRQWITAILSGHQSKEAAGIVADFLKNHPDYPYRLKNKILMAADPVFRAASILPSE